MQTQQHIPAHPPRSQLESSGLFIHSLALKPSPAMTTIKYSRRVGLQSKQYGEQGAGAQCV